MKNMPLMIAAGFTVASLVFLLWAGYNYNSAVADSEEAQSLWNETAKNRQRLADLRANVEIKRHESLEKAAPESPDVAIEAALADSKVTLKPKQMSISQTASDKSQVTTVRISDLTLEAMGKVLQSLRQDHHGVIIENLECAAVAKSATPGALDWTLRMTASKTTGTSSAKSTASTSDATPAEKPAEKPPETPAEKPSEAPAAAPVAAPASPPAPTAAPPAAVPEAPAAEPPPLPPPTPPEGGEKAS